MQNIATVVQQFIAALIALLNHPSTPAHAREWFNDAANEVANRAGFSCDRETLADALRRAFGIEPPDPASLILTPDKLDEDEDTRACLELGAAFAAIERHRDYLPAKLYNEISDCAMEIERLAQWQTKPELVEQIMPIIVRQAVKNMDAQQEVSQ